jgi:virulence factor Mce-like protein
VRRVLVTAAVLLAAGAVAFLATGAGNGSGAGKYWVELDNAFGLVNGGDLKIAGVRAGAITDIKLDRKTNRALVGFKITTGGFGSLRSDVQCDVRPQSLIGEYFLDCAPGTSNKVLPEGSVIPVTHTTSTIAPDLVQDVLRTPYKERLRIILGELGAGLGGNGQNLNDAIRRAVPALRETDKVLATLASQNRILADLTVNADKVVGDMAANHKDVGRWVLKARDTAVASAQRRAAIAAGFQRLPGFLEQLRPAMAALGKVADNQTPALQNLDASAQRLTRFFNLLGPFADASRPAFASLGKASQKGADAMRAAPPTINALSSLSTGAPELSRNLAIVLEHLDDRKYAVEDDPRSPGGKGFTGLEALLQYVYEQTLSTNVYDRNVHYLKIALIPNGDCANYADPARVKQKATAGAGGVTTGMTIGEECSSGLGPNQPGINYMDPTKTGTPAAARQRARQKRINGDRRPAPPQGYALEGTPGSQNPDNPVGGLPQTPTTPSGPAPSQPPPSQPSPSQPLPQLPPVPLPGLSSSGGGGGTDLPRAGSIGLSAQPRSSADRTALLDFLLGK